MDKALLAGVVAILITLIGGFASVMRQLGRLELKVDTMWVWWVDNSGGPKNPATGAPFRRRRQDG